VGGGKLSANARMRLVLDWQKKIGRHFVQGLVQSWGRPLGKADSSKQKQHKQ
jgi:hypothetical protein